MTKFLSLGRWISLSSIGRVPLINGIAHCWFNIHGIQTMDNSRICHCRCFTSMVSKNFVQPFLRSRELLCYTHAWTKTSQIVMSWISGANVITHGPYLKRTQLLCVIWRHRLWAACPCCRPQSFSVDHRRGVHSLNMNLLIDSIYLPKVYIYYLWFALARVQIWTSVRKFSVYGHKQP